MNPKSNINIDTLMAALYPHIHRFRVIKFINAPRSLRPDKSNNAVYHIIDSFAKLFALYPHCENVAVAVQTPLQKNMSLYVCPSPSTPEGFDVNVKKCLNQLAAIRAAYIGQAHGEQDISQLEERFIMDSYSLCFAAMRRQAISWKTLWCAFINPRDRGGDKGRKLKEKVSKKLAQVSSLMDRCMKTISDHETSLGDDTLNFHSVCLEISNAMKDKEFESYSNEYIYMGNGIGGGGVDHVLKTFFSLPIAISTILSSFKSLQLSFDNEQPAIVLKPSPGVRQFRATMTVEHLREHFGDPDGIDWEEVVYAFNKEQVPGKGLDWNAQEHVFSSKGPVTLHPEVALIEHLLNMKDAARGLNVYIACSTTPCYASLAYAGAVNNVLQEQKWGLKFTMRTNDLTWCRLSSAEPWILPENTTEEIVGRLKEELLEELECMMDAWDEDVRAIGMY